MKQHFNKLGNVRSVKHLQHFALTLYADVKLGMSTQTASLLHLLLHRHRTGRLTVHVWTQAINRARRPMLNCSFGLSPYLTENTASQF